MNKFTPGPWVASKESPKIIMQSFAAIGADGPMTGSVTGNDSSGFYVSEAEAAANALLFIAAPDLLEALEALIERYAAAVGNEGIECYKARAAIAKARGES